jgi:uncharacterized protein
VHQFEFCNAAANRLPAPLLSEYRMVLSRPEFNIQKELRLQFLQRIKDVSRLVSPSRQIRVTPDPDDNIFLECADAARANCLVTGNLRHFPKFWKRTKIVPSSEFITMITPHLVP